MSQLAPIRIDAVEVRQDSHGRFCLNDLHRAGGGEDRHQPAYFMRRQETAELLQELSRNSADSQSFPPVATVVGRNGGTYVARELVYAYAMWVSPAFHLKVIRTFDAVARGLQPQARAPGTLAQALRLATELAERVEQLELQLAARPSTAPGVPPPPPADPGSPGSPPPRRRLQTSAHPWEGRIRAWLEAHPGVREVSTLQLLAQALGLPEPTHVQQSAVGRCMRQLGWGRERRRIGGGKLRYVYLRPE